jgi:putative hydrolase of the HAD superfamily
MNTIKAIIFDADGVVIPKAEPFSHGYARHKGFDPAELLPFFEGPFQDALVGAADLKDIIEQNRDLWRWNGPVEELVKQWFEAENIVDKSLTQEIQAMGVRGIKCILATNQERYRTAYLRDVMFTGVFDQIYSSAHLGVKKPDPTFYAHILESIREDNIKPEDVVYFDDNQENVDAANGLGIRAVLYTGIQDFYSVMNGEEIL